MKRWTGLLTIPAALAPAGCVVYSEAPAWSHPAPVRACPQVVCPPAGFASPAPALPPAATPVELEPVAPAQAPPPPPKVEVGAPEVAVPALTPAAPDTPPPPPPAPSPARPMARRRSTSAN